jgi:glycosyltransferase involved in cell wall biosynthesis
VLNQDEDLAERILRDGILDPQFYVKQVEGVQDYSPLEMARHYLEYGEADGIAPSGLFDPQYYLMLNPDLAGIAGLTEHYVRSGREEGRAGSVAQQLIDQGLDEVAVTHNMVPTPSVERSDPRYVTAFAEAMQVIDRDPRYFSNEFYRQRHPDIGSQPIHPFVHFLGFGLKEGRATNVDLLDGIHLNEEVTDPRKPYIIVGVHEASTTGAPIVGMDIALELQATYNVIFLSMKEGPLMDRAREKFPVCVVTTNDPRDLPFFVDYIAGNYDVSDAIFSSSVCYIIIDFLAAKNLRITCLVHEFLEYMAPAKSLVWLTDLLVFSSRELLKSWKYLLDDVNRDPETVMVLPQPSSSASVRALSRPDARAAVASMTGLDLDDAVLVVAAGQVQIRKGTDIFLQIGSQLKREKQKYVAIWIGEQVSEFDPAYGIWFHAQIERSRDRNGNAGVHFEPAGPLYPILMDAADVFLVTSRLDPLPNVALDAAGRDVPVIAFTGATGLRDVAEQGQMELVEVEFAAVDEVIAAIKTLTGRA